MHNTNLFKFIFAILFTLQYELAFAETSVCNRTAVVVEELEYRTKKPCAEINASDLASVSILAFSRININAFNRDDFLGLTNLYHLNFYGSTIRQFPRGLFRDLKNLQIFVLQYSTINLSESIFEGLSSLQEIWFSQSQIQSLPKNIFRGLSSLREIYFNQCGLKNIDANQFQGLTNLRLIDLSINKLSSNIPKDLFKGLTNLKSIFLSYNEISTLSEGLLDGLTSLRGVSFYGNEISYIPRGFFSSLGNINYIDLNSNKLTTISKDTFKGLSYLGRLDLSQNKIENIEDGAFFDGTPLCHPKILISMKGNPLNEFPPEKLPKFKNPYQCPIQRLDDYESDVREPFHLNMVRLDALPPEFSQLEYVIPSLEKSFVKSYFTIPITANYGFGLIPSLDGTELGLDYVRQLAVEVCDLVYSFCTLREEIHSFPTLDHLAATTKLKEELIAANASEATISKVKELELALTQMFSMDLDYMSFREFLPEGSLKTDLDLFFGQDSWSLEQIADICSKIEFELVQSHDEEWKGKYFVPIFKIKSFLILKFKKMFWSKPAESLLDVQTLRTLITLSHSVSLLSSTEAKYLRRQVDIGTDFKTIIQKASQWQLKNLEREHFSQPNDPTYVAVSAEYQDPKINLQPLFEKIVRTSMLAEWDRLAHFE